jgi:hypothetical protein
VLLKPLYAADHGCQIRPRDAHIQPEYVHLFATQFRQDYS